MFIRKHMNVLVVGVIFGINYQLLFSSALDLFVEPFRPPLKSAVASKMDEKIKEADSTLQKKIGEFAIEVKNILKKEIDIIFKDMVTIVPADLKKIDFKKINNSLISKEEKLVDDMAKLLKDFLIPELYKGNNYLKGSAARLIDDIVKG